MLAKRVRIALVSALAGSFVALHSTVVYAQASTSSGSTIGDRLQAAMSDMVSPLFFVLSLVAFCGGLYLFAKGLILLKDAAQGNRGETGQALLTLVAATCLILLPTMAGVGITSIFGADGLFTSNDLNAAEQALDSGTSTAGSGIAGLAKVTAPTSCIGSATPVDCMAKNIAQNAVPVGVIAIFVVAFLAGLGTFLAGLVELTKGDRQGPGFWGKMLGSVLLMNAIYFFLIASNSLLGTGVSVISTSGVQTSSSLLTYTNASLGSTFAQYADLISQVFLILTFFGAFAFVKGVFMLKDAGDGRGQATYAAGGVFVFAGVLLANSKYTACLILTTVGGVGALAGMC